MVVYTVGMTKIDTKLAISKRISDRLLEDLEDHIFHGRFTRLKSESLDLLNKYIHLFTFEIKQKTEQYIDNTRFLFTEENLEMFSFSLFRIFSLLSVDNKLFSDIIDILKLCKDWWFCFFNKFPKHRYQYENLIIDETAFLEAYFVKENIEVHHMFHKNARTTVIYKINLD